MLPNKNIAHHPAYPLLWEYATKGCPVACGPPWTTADIEAAIRRGSHPSAKVPEAASACRTEALERVHDGCCQIVQYKTIEENPPAQLKVSPIAAIPHKSRAYRMILDLAYSLRLPHGQITSVNDASDKSLAPHHAMDELGNVIPRLAHQMASSNDKTTPFLFTKVDLKDGYWRMVVSDRAAWNFAYVLPTTDQSTDVNLVVPTSLQMGWSESPAFFCAATETARDVAADRAARHCAQPPHPMETTMLGHLMPPDPPSCNQREAHTPITLFEVYIDDFIVMTQSTNPAHIQHLTRCLLHAIEDVFPGPNTTGSGMGPAISQKKLIAEGKWETTKEILGWQIDGTAKTMSLPANKASNLINKLRELRRTKAIRVKDLQKLHGRLQHAAY